MSERKISVRLQGRLIKIPCQVTDTLLSILDKACEKLQLDSAQFYLAHFNKPLDLSLSLQFSRVPNNAILEAEELAERRVETDINLVLQLDNGQRISGVFSPKVNLFDIIMQLAKEEYEKNPNLILIYMRNEIYGEENLKTTTLRRLGLISGRALFRIMHTKIDQLKVQPNVSSTIPVKPKVAEEDSPAPVKKTEPVIVEKSKDLNLATKPKPENGYQNDENLPSSSQSQMELSSPVKNPPDSTQEMEIPKTEEFKMETEDNAAQKTEDSQEIIYLGTRNALAFSQRVANKFQFDDFPDEFYELTSAEVRRLMNELEKKRIELENKPLATSSLRAIEENKKVVEKVNKYTQVIIRVYFPDQTVLQGVFQPSETIADVKDFIRMHLQDSSAQFVIYTSPPKNILEPDLRLIDSDCMPNAIVYFSYNDSEKTKFLSEEILEKLTSPEVAHHSVYKKDDKPQECEMKNEANNKKIPSSSQNPSTAKIPKWFKPL